ncbi:putative transmembrane protein [Gregarina niphandrodes]|uniref:Transmembrane protein n=1 Tax=Gregarina niphandrodes TaxID=110365 RepID=A0A023B0F2_GRENI|nr:putative transmembrane protein [Gregarina niphandrodes]EZG44843.1 putative transmembrane protein [Gregarina niphandrodes]|eukprot:XP_011132645.1 putative transmembrane protein [Gregarina niphandrodes]
MGRRGGKVESVRRRLLSAYREESEAVERRRLRKAPGVAPKCKLVTQDKLARAENRHVALQSGQEEWKERLKEQTRLPTFGQVGSEPEGGAEVEVATGRKRRLDKELNAMETKRLAREDQKRKREEAVERLGFKNVSGLVSVPEREAIAQCYKDHCADVEKLVSGLELIGQAIIAEPLAKLHLLEAFIKKMEECRVAYRRCSDLNDLADLAKLYLLVVTAVGKILLHVLPGYVIAEGDPVASVKRQVRRHELLILDMYRRWLLEHFGVVMKDPYFNGVQKHEYTTLLVVQLNNGLINCIEHARQFNYRDEFMQMLVDYYCLQDHGSLDTSGMDTDAVDVDGALSRAISEVLKEDVTLAVSAKLVPLISNKVLKMRKDSSSGKVLRLLDHLNIQKKEKNAVAELKRKGIDQRSLLKDRRTQVEKNVANEQTASLVSGDYKKFLANKKNILESIMVMFARILRSPHLYSLEVVYEALRSLSKHAAFVNMELAAEFYEELRQVVQTMATADVRSGAIIFAAVMAALELMDLSSKGSDLYIESDVQWITTAVLEACATIIPFLGRTAAHTRVHLNTKDDEPKVKTPGEDEEELSRARTAAGKDAAKGRTGLSTTAEDSIDLFAIGCTQLTLQEFESVLNKVIDTKRAFGVTSADLAHLARSAKATAIYVTLAGAALTATPAVAAVLHKAMDKLAKKFPSLKDTHDPEGMVFDSLSPPKTIAWCQHLAKMSINL